MAVGASGGIASSVLKELTHAIAHYLQDDFHWPFKYYLYLLFPLIGIVLTIVYVSVFIRKRPFQHGIPPIIYSVIHRSSMLDFHNIYSQIITSALTVGLGGSAGLEAPAVASGASIGSNIGRFFNLTYREVTLLLACGGAAGIAGAFNSPIAGMIFSIEVLLPDFSLTSVVPLLIASAVASVVAQMIYHEPLFVLVTQGWHPDAFWFYVLFAALFGIYSIYFSKINTKLNKVFRRIRNKYTRALIGGLLLGILIALMPALYGEGYITIQKLLNGNYHSILVNSFFFKYQSISWVIVVFSLLSLVGKTVACSITMSAGGNGGMFGPSVVVGGLSGFAFAYGLSAAGIAQLDVTNFIVAGMAASVSAVMHAPLTGIFLAAEITGGYVLIVPLMIVSAIAYFINKKALYYSIYTIDLANKGDFIDPDNQDHKVLSRIKLKYLLETDFVVLKINDRLSNRKDEIVHTRRNVFPVVNDTGKLIGIVYSDTVLEYLLSENIEDRNKKVGEIALAIEHLVEINTPMARVMQKMERWDIRMLPVVDDDQHYMGFISKNGIFNRYRHILKRQHDANG